MNHRDKMAKVNIEFEKRYAMKRIYLVMPFTRLTQKQKSRRCTTRENIPYL